MSPYSDTEGPCCHVSGHASPSPAWDTTAALSVHIARSSATSVLACITFCHDPKLNTASNMRKRPTIISLASWCRKCTTGLLFVTLSWGIYSIKCCSSNKIEKKIELFVIFIFKSHWRDLCSHLYFIQQPGMWDQSIIKTTYVTNVSWPLLSA